ncbi:MAG: cation:proton antiporter [Anderseniella sp.]|jgi:CPA2 family monovalent cation:H+ antiporter-2|nr:cation:proton antiporter [Anderseniella sp.]
MPHDITLISTIAASLVLASIFGFVAQRLRLPPLIGYLVAGVVVGPIVSGDIADRALASQLAEIGIMLMMFGVGLHFSVADLMAVRRVAIPGAMGQIIVATAMTAALTLAWGWSLGAGLVLGLSLSVASTAVLLKALDSRNAITTTNGRISVGWLIVEDLAMVLALVLLPALAGVLGGVPSTDTHAVSEQSVLASLGITLAKVSGFIAIALLVGPVVLPRLLKEVARTGSRELFTLAVLAMAIGIAFAAAKLAGVSFALGAFFAGMVLNKSELSQKAAANSLPLQDAFGVLFFVSIGMLFDPTVLVREPTMVAAVLGLILVGKSAVAIIIVLLLGYPLSTALTVGAALAQIGEFSFILGGLGLGFGLLDTEGFNLILAGALFSITLSPVVFAGADRLSARVRASPLLNRLFEERQESALQRVQTALDEAREQAERHAAAIKTFTPEELAAAFPLFSGLTPEQRETLVLHFQPYMAVPGERIIRAGDPADALYLISKGEVEVTINGQRIKTRGPGEFFGEMALLSGDRRSADVTALDYSRFARLSGRDFHRFLSQHPEIRTQITALANQRAESAGQALRQPES